MNIKKAFPFMPAAACAMVIVFACISGFSEWNASTFIPFNGHFQNYWSLARFSAGQIPFVDFPVYLGAGHLYAAWPLFEILGADFRASTAAHNALAGASIAASVIITCRLLGWRYIPTLIFTAGMWQIFITMATAWSSVIGFRSFLPALVALIVIGLLPEKEEIRKTLIYGFVAGLCPFWSNDYGIPSTVAMFAVLLMYSGIRNAVLCLPAVISGVFIGAFAVSLGHPVTWLHSAILEPGSVQTWYFNPIAENKIYSFADFPWYDPAFILGCITLGIILLLVHKQSYNPEDRKRLYALLCLMMCATGGFALSCLAGTYEQRYAIPLWRYIIPAAPGIFFVVFMKTRAGNALRSRYPLFSAHPVLSGFMALIFTGMALGYAEKPFVPVISLGSPEDPLVYSPSLKVNTWPQVVEADLTGRRFAAEHIRVGADYSSVISVASGSMQAVSPYIIHAAGPESSKLFMLNLTRYNPEIWETLDPDKLVWGLWNIRMSWPLHRELFLTRYPAERTAWTLLWKKRAVPRVVMPASCTVVSSTGRPEIRIETDRTETWWADVTIQVKASFEQGLTPIAGKTGLVDLTEGEDPPPGADPTSVVSARWTAPLQSGKLEAPAMVSSHAPGRIRIRGWPVGRSSVSIESCSANLVAPVSETLLGTPPLLPYEIRTMRGIQPFETQWHEHGQTAIRVITANPYAALPIRRGDGIIFQDGTKGIIVLRDFGNFAYVTDKPAPLPEPGSTVRIIPSGVPQDLGVLVRNITP